jgi:hypothetical protein
LMRAGTPNRRVDSTGQIEKKDAIRASFNNQVSARF